MWQTALRLVHGTAHARGQSTAGSGHSMGDTVGGGDKVPAGISAGCPRDWFGIGIDARALESVGFKPAGGGVHQTKTMMLRELEALLRAVLATDRTPRSLVESDNVLGKPTGSARALAFARLKGLYGVGTARSPWRVLHQLWSRDPAGRPLLALLCALSGDPLLRASAAAVLPLTSGSSIRWPTIAAHLEATHPARFSAKMLKSLAQNCASTWTQSGHLQGKVRKVRATPVVTPVVAAYAAWLATLAGFGGPVLLDSPWLAVLDRSTNERLALLRQAEALGLLRVRAAGDMLEIAVKRPLAQALGMPDLGEL